MHPAIQELVESVIGGAPFAVGNTVQHPDGRAVKITGGQYYSNGRLSNFWYWHPVDAKGKPAGPTECGYGWR